MKKLAIIALILFFALPAWAEEIAKKQVTETIYYLDKDGKPEAVSICPKTQISDNDKCLACHTEPDFVLKPIPEKDLFETFKPPYGIEWVRGESGYKDYLRYDIHGAIDDHVCNRIRNLFEYASKHEIKHVVIDILSGGGLMFSGWQAVGIIEEWKKIDFVVETRAYSFTGSAASFIFAAGSEGWRRVSPTAQLMFHELWTFKMFAIEQPSSSEDEAKILRHLQDTGTQWLSERSRLSKAEWDQEMKRKDFWMNGMQAVETYGIADGYL